MILLFFILFYAISIELRVVLKTFDDLTHIFRYNAFEELEFTGGRVSKSQTLRVQRMSGTCLEAIRNELLVLCKGSTL